MATPPTQGTISYNGYTFPVETETLSVKIVPVEDAAGRTFIGNRYTIVIRSLIALFASDTDPDTGNKLAAIRRQLTTPGGAFTYTGKGLGDVKINVAGGAKDTMWGPKPRELEWRPEAGNLAGTITWQIEFMTNDCSNAHWAFDLMEFGYTVEYSHGKNRLTARNYSGHIRIPTTRISAGQKKLTDTADAYFERIAPPTPFGFQRDNERRQIDESKTILTFSFMDAQLTTALPIGIITCDVSHRQTNTEPMAFIKWGGNLSASYETALHVPPAITFKHFSDLISDRITALKRPWVPVTFEMTERINGRELNEMNYTLSYWYVMPIEAILTGQFWRPMPNTNHRLWARSMQVATVPRGYTQDHIRPVDDAIIDLCPPPVPAIGTGSSVPIVGQATVSLAGVVINSTRPTPGQSWIWYQCSIIVSMDQGTATHQGLPTKPLPKPKPPSSLTDLIDPTTGKIKEGINPKDLLSNAGQAATKDPKAKLRQQQRSSPTIYIYLRGFAVRAGFEAPPPVLISVGGAIALPANREGVEFYSQTVIFNAGVPIYLTVWSLRYVLTEFPQRPAKSPINPNAPQNDTWPIEFDSNHGPGAR